MAKGIGGQVPRLHGFTWSDIPEGVQDAYKREAVEDAQLHGLNVRFFEELDPAVRREVRKLGAEDYWEHHS